MSEIKALIKSPAIFIATVSAIGYGLAYMYEWGYCDVFGIPTQFIILSWTSIVLAVSAVFGIFIVAFWLIGFELLTRPPKSKRRGPIARRILSILSVCLLILIIYIRYPRLGPELLLFVPLILLFVFIYFIAPIISKGANKYIDKLEMQDKSDKIFWDSIVQRLGGFGVAAMIFLLVAALGFSFLSGRGEAMSEERFFIPSTHPDSLVLRIYGNNLICAPFEYETKTIHQDFFLIKLDDEPRPILRLVELGPLESLMKCKLKNQEQ